MNTQFLVTHLFLLRESLPSKSNIIYNLYIYYCQSIHVNNKLAYNLQVTLNFVSNISLDQLIMLTHLLYVINITTSR